MRIDIGGAQLTAQDIRIMGVPPLGEVKIDAQELIITNDSDGKLWIRSATGSLVVTEAAINKAITGTPIEKVRGLDLKTYAGFIRITGRYEALASLAVPFTVTAAPEIESGARIRMAVRDVNVAGALPMPNFVVNLLASRINEQLAKSFDATRLPIPIRLTGVTVEPGRMKLSLSLEMPLESAPDSSASSGAVPAITA